MTSPAPDRKDESVGVSLPLFVAVTAVVIVGAFAAVWFAIPGPDTNHVLTAPSGTRSLELAELCGPNGCTRVAVLDLVAADDSHTRTYCPLERPEVVPVFATLAASWSPSEDSITITFTPPEGHQEALTIALADCTRTQ